VFLRNECRELFSFVNGRVQKFTSQGKFLGTFAVQPYAGGLAVDADGNVYVAHWNSNKVAAYSPTSVISEIAVFATRV
jgi:sugar lactone lactonase YvrE